MATEDRGNKVRIGSNGASRRINLKMEFFTVNKFLIRYMARLAKIAEDDRWPTYVGELAEVYDSDLERMEKQIGQIRKEFAASRAATEEEDGR